jgi:asparagine synthase (glutamine-hydrolysing)
MCGVFGIIQPASMQIDSTILDAASKVQAHRGPDASGIAVFQVENTRLILGHQRLSIIDLTDAGRQPMTYGSEQGCVVYNGELYNYLELRTELARAGERFSTQSDTEVLLAALHHWGPNRALEKFNWMGAFAWFDKKRARVVLARDAGSEKPLYYCVKGKQLFFASEIKTLLTLTGSKFELDRNVVGQFIFQGLSDASPQTFFRGITQLEASSYVDISLLDIRYQLKPVHYQPPQYPGDPATMPLDDFIEEVRRVFVDSVRLRLRSDVPVGVLLSGGVDSSAIAAITHRLEGPKNGPQLLSAISDDPRFDESEHIAVMEQHLGQVGHKITLRTEPKTLIQDISKINWFNDAPVTGLSALGHFRLMEHARKVGLTVILSGQGADEILLGYRKFLGFYLQSLVRRGRFLRAMTVLTKFMANRTIVNQFNVGDAKRYVPLLRTLSNLRYGQESDSDTEGAWLKGWQPIFVGLGSCTLAERQLLDIQKYSVPSLCHYEDRMSMAMSREVRLPFLDPRLIDLLIRAPDNFKLRDGWTKYAFRKAMERILPPSICWRKDKQGFSNPQGEWLKHELHEQVIDAFSSDSLLAQKEIIDSKVMLRKYDRYCRQSVTSGMIWYREIFAPLSLELWMREYENWID